MVVIESTRGQTYSISEWQQKFQYDNNCQFIPIDKTYYQKIIRTLYSDRRHKKLLDLGVDRTGIQMTGCLKGI